MLLAHVDEGKNQNPDLWELLLANSVVLFQFLNVSGGKKKHVTSISLQMFSNYGKNTSEASFFGWKDETESNNLLPRMKLECFDY